MQRVITSILQLQSSITDSKIDFSLLQRLKSEVTQCLITQQTFEAFIKSMMMLYEISNSQKLYTVKRASIQISQMAIELKLLVCLILSQIIKYLSIQQTLLQSYPEQILSEALEIMILCTRVCLNDSIKSVSLLQEYYQSIHAPFQLFSSSLSRNLQFIHHLNTLELMRFKCQSETFLIVEFMKRLQKVRTFEEWNISDYRAFIQNIVMEVVLKGVKNGKVTTDQAQKFFPYLSEENQKDLNSLIIVSSPNHSFKKIESSSDFLQLYVQIKDHGIDSISIEFLEEFMRKDKNFTDERIFEIAGLTLEPLILQTWFNILNSYRSINGSNRQSRHVQSSNSQVPQTVTSQAFSCFITVAQTLIYEHQHKASKASSLPKMLSLSTTVIFTLLTEKKSPTNSMSNLPFAKLIKTLVKVLNFYALRLYDNFKQMKEYAERIILVCSRFECMQVVKCVYATLLYYCLIKKIQCKDLYQMFKAYHSDSIVEKQREMYQMLSSAYLLAYPNPQNSEQPEKISEKQLIMTKPFIAILFAKQGQDMVLFQTEFEEFIKVQKKFFIYVEVLKKYHNVRNGGKKDQNNRIYAKQNVEKIIQHLEQFIMRLNFNNWQSIIEKSIDEECYAKELISLLEFILKEGDTQITRLQREHIDNTNTSPQDQISSNIIDTASCHINPRICFILINMLIFTTSSLSPHIQSLNFSILLNKYSTKIKLISHITELIKKKQVLPASLPKEFYHVCCCYLIYQLEKFKIAFIRKERIAEPGQVAFVNMVAELVQQLESAKGEGDRIKLQPQGQMQQDGINQTGEMRMSQKTQSQKRSDRMEQVKKSFIAFVIFEISCVTNNLQKYTLKCLSSYPLSLLKTFCHSVYIPKPLKQQILRLLIRQCLTNPRQQPQSDISLKQFKQLIQLTQDPEQVQLYMKYVTINFGEEGKKMLMLMAHENQRIQELLIGKKGNYGDQTQIEI